MKHRQVVTNALEQLTVGLIPFVEAELQRVHGQQWLAKIQSSFRRAPAPKTADGSFRWDAHAILTVMWDQWNAVFREKLGFLERSMVSELREYRNRWAHQTDFLFDDAYRIVDNSHRLLDAAGQPCMQLSQAKREMMHAEFSRQITYANSRRNNFRKTWMNIGLYSTCALGFAAVVIAAVPAPTNFIFAAGIGLALVFVIQAETRLRPRLVGPHECHWCHKIVYTEVCPYCQPELLLVENGLSPPIGPDRDEVEELRASAPRTNPEAEAPAQTG